MMVNEVIDACDVMDKVQPAVGDQLLSVPYGKAVYGEEEIAAVVKTLRESTQMGHNVEQMQQHIAALFAKQHGIMVNSGSSANFLAVEILGLEPGSEVITPALTFSTTVAPLLKNDLIPAFVDVEVDTFNIDADQVEQMITPKTKAMMIPNLLGNLPNWEQLSAIAKKHQLIVIEDSADALGATINNASSGIYTDVSTTSFYGSHIITCAGNGGMLAVNSPELEERAKLLRSWGRDSSIFGNKESESVENRFQVYIDDIQYDAKFVFSAVGYNLEPSEIGAAFGLVQLDKLQKNISTREKWFAKHMAFFAQFDDWFILPNQLAHSRTPWLAFPLIVKDNAPFTRTELQILFEKHRIQTRTIFTGNILRQPGFKSIACKQSAAGYPNADRVMRGGILLGCHHGLTEPMVDHIHNVFSEFTRGF